MLGVGPGEEVWLSRARPDWAREMVLRAALPAALRDGVWSGETALLSRDGREIPVHQVILAHRNAAGAVDFLSTIARDITARKRAEDDLRHAKEAAEAANRAKSQ